MNALHRAPGAVGRVQSRKSRHGFRVSASTLLHETVYEPAVIELQLSHAKRNKVAGIYDRSQRVPERRAMMQAWSDLIDGYKKLE